MGKEHSLDVSSFDHLAKQLGGALTRRNGVKAILATIATTLGVKATAARITIPPTCRNAGSACAVDDDCCSGRCIAKSDGKSRCARTTSNRGKREHRGPSPVPTATGVPGWHEVATIGSLGSGKGQFDSPRGIALSPDELELYVVDTVNDRISVWTRPNANASWTADQTFGNGAGSAQNQFETPLGISMADNGLDFYVADSDNNRVVRWSRSSLASQWAATETIGQGQGSGPTQLWLPGAVVVSENREQLFIAELQNARISQWATNGTDPWAHVTNVGSSGSGADQFSMPLGVTLSADMLELYIADTGNNRVSIWTRATSGDPFTAATALSGFSSPKGLVLSSDGLTLYVTDFGANRVVAWARATTSGTWAPSATIASLGLNGPYGIALSANDRTLFVSDMFNNRVVVYRYS